MGHKTPRYRKLGELFGLIDQPHRTSCRRILRDHRTLFETAQGSTYNHQAWTGGYIDHVTDGMKFVFYLYDFLSSFGRPLPFSRSDALLIFFLHDLEKPWRIVVDNEGRATNRSGLNTKAAFQNFREQKLVEYGISLTAYQMNALTYIEGEYKDYSSTHRVMNELASFGHMADNWCARGWYNYPKASDDEWVGAERFRTHAA